MESFLKHKQLHSHEQIMSQRFSQYEEDEVIHDFFSKLWDGNPERSGRFMEIGASDGKGGSNCLKLAFNGWSGVCVEANPFLWERLYRFYDGVDQIQTVCGCVGSRNGLVKFHMSNTGLDTADEENYQRLKGSVNFFGHTFIPLITPDDLANTFGNNFDYVSIDAEGMDMEILDASKRLIENAIMISVETDRPNQPREDWYQEHWKPVIEYSGFTKVYHQTKGNTLLIRP